MHFRKEVSFRTAKETFRTFIWIVLLILGRQKGFFSRFRQEDFSLNDKQRCGRSFDVNIVENRPKISTEESEMTWVQEKRLNIENRNDVIFDYDNARPHFENNNLNGKRVFTTMTASYL